MNNTLVFGVLSSSNLCFCLFITTKLERKYLKQFIELAVILAPIQFVMQRGNSKQQQKTLVLWIVINKTKRLIYRCGKNAKIKNVFVRWLTQSLRLDSGHYIGFPVEVDRSMDLSIPTDLVEAKKKI